MCSIIISLSTKSQVPCGEAVETTKRRYRDFCGEKGILKEYQNLTAACEGKWQWSLLRIELRMAEPNSGETEERRTADESVEILDHPMMKC